MNHNYEGLPERYMTVPINDEVDKDALSCALYRAEAVCLLIGANIAGSGKTQDGLSDEIISNACWALGGLIDQVRILSFGKEDKS